MSLPNYQTVGPVWEKYYSVKETYGALLDPPYTSPEAELVAAFWHNLTEVFEINDVVFQEYYARKQRGYNPVLCEETCKVAEICEMRSSQSQYACFPEDSPVSVKKRNNVRDHGHGDGGKCPGSQILAIFRAMGKDVQSLLRAVDERKRRRS